MVHDFDKIGFPKCFGLDGDLRNASCCAYGASSLQAIEEAGLVLFPAFIPWHSAEICLLIYAHSPPGMRAEGRQNNAENGSL